MRPKLAITAAGLAVSAMAAWLLIGSVRADASPKAAAQAAPADPTRVLAIMKANCYACHGPDKQEADVRLDGLNPDCVKGPHAEDWHEVLNVLNLGEMPPKERPPLKDSDRRALVDWITAELARAKDAKAGLAGKAVLRRMTRYEYSNTMTDLLGLELDYARSLPPESKSKDGFENNGMAMGMSPMQLEYYLETARQGLAEAIIEGERPPLHEGIASHASPRLNRAAEFQPDYKGLVLPGRMYDTKPRDFPRGGTVRITVRLHRVIVPEGQGYPQMMIGVAGRALMAGGSIAEIFRTDVVPRKDGGPVEVVYTGRIDPAMMPEKGDFEVVVANDLKLVDAELNKRKGEYLAMLGELGKAEIAKNKANGVGKERKKKPKKSEEPVELDLQDPTLDLPEPPVSSFVVKSVTFEGPIYDQWPPSYHRQILFDRPSGMDEGAYAKEVIRRFIDRAYRRPVTDADVALVYDFYQSIRSKMPSFESAIREALALVLINPEFLYLVEPAGEQGGSTALTDYERASRLSYLIWSTMPDKELRAAADKGLLSNPVELEKQARRMLRDKRSEAFVHHFTSQWLDLPAVERVAINPDFYPGFDEKLKGDMKRETIAFFGELLRGDLSAMNLIDSDFVVVNRPMAEHYGLPAPKGLAFERVPIPGNKQRGGLLTQASMLLMNSDGEDSHPIRRAVWLRSRLLDDPPAPPPPNVPPLDSGDPKFESLSLKRQLELHRKEASCNDCHVRIDPWGIPLENYDAVGLWREGIMRPKLVRPAANKKSKPVYELEAVSEVVADSDLPGGQHVDGIDDLKKVLASDRKAQFVQGLVRYMFAYCLGRSLNHTDREDVDALVKAFEKNGYQLDELLIEIIMTKSFGTK